MDTTNHTARSLITTSQATPAPRRSAAATTAHRHGGSAHRGRRTLAVALVGVALVGAACSGGSDPTSTPATSDPADALFDYAQCMRENGVEDYPDPQSAGDLVIGAVTDDPDLVDADEVCQPLLRDAVGGFEPPSAEEMAETEDRMLEYAQCMRDRGIDFPDPVFSDDGSIEIGGPSDPGLALDSASFAEANEACGSFIAAPPIGGGR